ncbi:DUF981 family protein [Brevibacterium spongiae]|uniref:DUF981 domain-containing protein n=1 Tax=Brevibacterium spongiae TaxID=2909672 RepID=A0ABY5SLJ1_9MICO|nr:DUF981 family protein [Brevibacterium spongiae]UVI35402.1 DUF981 domain-containing protein [Brevibacterium spongiae]
MKTFFTGVESPGMIDWASMPTYNTIMSIAVGAGLLAVVLFYRELSKASVAGGDGSPSGRATGSTVSTWRGRAAGLNTDGWALTFGVLGLILTGTGLHMSLTWPLASGGFAFDNVIFGETSLAFGVLMLAAAWYLWKRGVDLKADSDPLGRAASTVRPLSIFIAALGLALFAIALAGIVYQLFAAPPQEPISGAFAEHPLIEATFMSLLFALVGIGAVVFPFAVRAVLKAPVDAPVKSGAVTVAGVVWTITGIVFVLFGAMNFYTHIGLIVNTM